MGKNGGGGEQERQNSRHAAVGKTEHRRVYSILFTYSCHTVIPTPLKSHSVGNTRCISDLYRSYCYINTNVAQIVLYNGFSQAAKCPVKGNVTVKQFHVVEFYHCLTLMCFRVFRVTFINTITQESRVEYSRNIGVQSISLSPAGGAKTV